MQEDKKTKLDPNNHDTIIYIIITVSLRSLDDDALESPKLRNMEFRWAAATCILFFLVGFFTAPDHYSGDDEISASSLAMDSPPSKLNQNNHHENDLRSVLHRQEKAQKAFQTQIQGLQQSPDKCDADTRKLLVKRNPATVGANLFEKFAREFQYLSLSLQVAVATDRTLVLEDGWKLLSDVPEMDSDCSALDITFQGHGLLKSISCLRQAVISRCGDVPNYKIDSTPLQRQQQTQTLLDSSSLAFGIIPGLVIDKQNALFHAQYYGPDLVVEMPLWPYPRSTYLIDIVPQWERSRGRFWVRSQMAHYLWEQWHATLPTTTARTSDPVSPASSRPYLAIYWISSKQMRKNLAAKYGRNATVTQTMYRYMKIANVIRKEHEPSLKTIYLITDGTDDVPLPDNLEDKWPGWHFIRPFSLTANDEKAMLASLECMRQATYLIGSFQSQMFRLAAELNAARYSALYPVTKRRHWTVDVEWFENP